MSLEVNMHFCFKCGCIGPCECWIEEQVSRMERPTPKNERAGKWGKKRHAEPDPTPILRGGK